VTVEVALCARCLCDRRTPFCSQCEGRLYVVKTFVRELWNSAAKPMADTLLLTVDTATAAIATESMILVQSCKTKYTDELQVSFSKTWRGGPK
jgi:hypothetical protein